MEEGKNQSITGSKIFIGQPSLEEIKRYFLKEKKLSDIRSLERRYETERDSPELSESFEIFLQERKKKAAELKLLETENKLEVSEISSDKEDSLIETLCDDSFLEMEKLCENTLTLNNVSAHLVDLTSLEMQEEVPKKPLKMLSEEGQSFLHDIEAPSFLMNNTLLSPANSPFKLKRPSTIMEVSELSLTTKSGLTSYQTAEGLSGTEKSEDYQTAYDDSWMSKKAEKKSEMKFCKDSFNFTKDSLDVSATQYSLNNKENITIELESDESFDVSKNMNDTLEAIEKILARGVKQQENTPIKTATVITPKQPSKASPSPWTAKNFQAKPSPLVNRVLSPMMKFSPTSNVKSPQANFKLPKQTSKTPQFSSLSKQKFQHIVSPISRYINNTPEIPLSNAHIHAQYGVSGCSRQFNFRDSESFSAETSVKASASSLPVRAKTTSSKKVFDIKPANTIKVPGGNKIHNLLGHSSPSVVVHKSQAPMSSSKKIFHDNTLLNDSVEDASIVENMFAEEIKRK